MDKLPLHSHPTLPSGELNIELKSAMPSNVPKPLYSMQISAHATISEGEWHDRKPGGEKVHGEEAGAWLDARRSVTRCGAPGARHV